LIYSEITYSLLLDALGKAGRLDEAFRLLDIIEQTGIKPNVVTMSTLIDACGRNGQLGNI
jgi:pentatricopeptide repeat protein